MGAMQLITHAKSAGLSPDLVECMERELAPKLERVLEEAPECPPEDEPTETALLRSFSIAYQPCMPEFVYALDKLADVAAILLDDLQAPDLLADIPRRRSLHHLEEAVASLVKVGTLATLLIERDPRALDSVPTNTGADDDDFEDLLDGDTRVYLRGLFSLLVAFDRIRDEQLTRFAPWAWMARRDLLKGEVQLMVDLQRSKPASTQPVVRRPGGWRGRVWIADDFDEPLEPGVSSAFYESKLSPEP